MTTLKNPRGTERFRRLAAAPPTTEFHSREAMRCALVLMVGLLACGEPQPGRVPVAEPRVSKAQGAERLPKPAGESMRVTGLVGTVSPADVQRAMERKLGRFQRCFFDGMREVEFLSGAVDFAFRIGADGRVTSVFLRHSTVGHAGTEDCMLEVAGGTRFPSPRGGDSAEFSWGFELDGVGGVRPPVPWSPEQLAAQGPDFALVLQRCAVPSASVTLYVEPGGRVLSAGIASETQPQRGPLHCVVEAVSELIVADPGSYPAKTTVSLP